MSTPWPLYSKLLLLLPWSRISRAKQRMSTVYKLASIRLLKKSSRAVQKARTERPKTDTKGRERGWGSWKGTWVRRAVAKRCKQTFSITEKLRECISLTKLRLYATLRNLLLLIVADLLYKTLTVDRHNVILEWFVTHTIKMPVAKENGLNLIDRPINGRRPPHA